MCKNIAGMCCWIVYSDSDSKYQKNVFFALKIFFFGFLLSHDFCVYGRLYRLFGNDSIRHELSHENYFVCFSVLSHSTTTIDYLCVMNFYCFGSGELVKVTTLTLKRFFWSRNWVFSSILDHKIGRFVLSTWKLCNLFHNKEKSI